MRLLYLYPEEWTGLRAREVQTLSTCAALAESGVAVTLVIAGGETELHDHLIEITDATEISGLDFVVLPRALGPLESTSIFSRNFMYWLRNRHPFDLAYTIHLKAGPILTQAGIPYVYEAHCIFAQTPESPVRQRTLHKLEGHVLAAASLLVATNMPLAVALSTWFSLDRNIAIVPNAGLPPLDRSIATADGPFVYCGSIENGSELAGVVQAARETKMPLKIIGGTEEEWQTLGGEFDTGEIEWQPRVPLNALPEFLAGARAGLVPTNPDTASGEFSCPIKLFDYTRCGLPIITTALPALQSLDVGLWCTQVASPTRVAWSEALRNFKHEPEHAEAARAWSGEHTWIKRAELLVRVFGQ
jgi:hypothetical protein